WVDRTGERSRDAAQRRGQSRIVHGIDGTQVAYGPSLVGPGYDGYDSPAEHRGVVPRDADSNRRDVESGHGSPSGHRGAVDDGANFQRRRSLPEHVRRDRGHPPERYGVSVAAEVRQGCLLKGGENQPARSEGPSQRMAGTARHQIGSAGDDPSLGPPEQLVGREGDQI